QPPRGSAAAATRRVIRARRPAMGLASRVRRATGAQKAHAIEQTTARAWYGPGFFSRTWCDEGSNLKAKAARLARVVTRQSPHRRTREAAAPRGTTGAAVVDALENSRMRRIHAAARARHT